VDFLKGKIMIPILAVEEMKINNFGESPLSGRKNNKKKENLLTHF